MRFRVTVVSVLTLWGATAVVEDAHAAFRRVNPTGCGDQNFYDADGANIAKLVWNPGWANTDTFGHFLTCPADEDSTLWVDSAVSLGVRVLPSSNATANIFASACVIYDQAAGGACGVQAFSSGSAPQFLFPSLSVWNQTWFGETYAGDFPYVNVYLPPMPAGATPNTLLGYNIDS